MKKIFKRITEFFNCNKKKYDLIVGDTDEPWAKINAPESDFCRVTATGIILPMLTTGNILPPE